MNINDNDSPQLDDPRIVEALDEYLAALESGHKLDRQAFLSRHADIADALADCLEVMEALHTASSESGQPSAPPRDALAGAAGLQEGMPLGDYRIVQEIGRGGMGVVYEAEQLSLGRRIALKVLPFALTLDPRQLQRFKNEARAAAQLHHQHIVPVYAVGSERGVHFYAMQYIEGQSLAEVIHDLRLQETGESVVSRDPMGSASADATGPYVPLEEIPAPETVRSQAVPGSDKGAIATSYSANSTGFYRTVARLGIQAAEALEHAHEYGVIHRDIKPGNLMVDAHGHLWITDFGLAQFQTDVSLTQSGDLLGTLRYMSPEQAGGSRLTIDHRTDIYSLGATLYEMLTLHPPFEGGNRHTLLHQILNEEPRQPRAYRKSIPAELETIILKALAKSPAERYATARELADDLGRFLHDQPIRARRTTAVQRLRKWARRHPSVVWAAVVLCLLTVAGSLVSAEIIRQKTKDAYEREKIRAQEAEDDFKLAREALDGMFQLYEEELSDKPFLDGLRRRLLQDYFLVYYQKLIDRHQDNPAAQELSATRARVLDILDKLAELQGLGLYHLLNREDVAEDLEIDRRQREQIHRLTEDMKWKPWELQKLSSEQRLQRFLDNAHRIEDQANQILIPRQQKRLRQIDLQIKGPRAFEEQSVIRELDLSVAQRERIRTIQAQDFRAAFGDCHPHPQDKCDDPPPPGPPPGPFPPTIATKPPRFDPVVKIESDVLTEKQKQQWRELKGKPFESFWHPPGFRPAQKRGRDHKGAEGRNVPSRSRLG
jgi:serine/threonine protein kinase